MIKCQEQRQPIHNKNYGYNMESKLGLISKFESLKST